MSEFLFVGLDAGGTKTAALATLGDRTLRLEGPAAQALRDGPEAAARVVATLIADARTQLGDAPLGAVAVGLAGAGRDGVRQSVLDALRPSLDGAALAVTHDADIAYHAAWGAESGALLLVGTGSLVFARVFEPLPPLSEADWTSIDELTGLSQMRELGEGPGLLV